VTAQPTYYDADPEGRGSMAVEDVETVEIHLLGGFAVTVDGVPTPSEGWRRRQAAALVKLLALAPQRTLHRERVIDALWPDVSVEEAAPRLHKAAHYARKALGHDRGLLLGGEAVALYPDVEVGIDVQRFEALAARAVATADNLAHTALAEYGGELLPGDIYEPWTNDERERLRLRHAELLRYAERWEELLVDDPADGDPSGADAPLRGPGRPASGAAAVRAHGRCLAARTGRRASHGRHRPPRSAARPRRSPTVGPDRPGAARRKSSGGNGWGGHGWGGAGGPGTRNGSR
jgi:hypothetical protein